jgi:hypothetical protein
MELVDGLGTRGLVNCGHDDSRPPPPLLAATKEEEEANDQSQGDDTYNTANDSGRLCGTVRIWLA